VDPLYHPEGWPPWDQDASDPGTGYESAVISGYQERTKNVDATLLRIFLYGASTRLTGQALHPLVGETVSVQTVSNIAEVGSYSTACCRD
jgi:hypothetical protein